MMLTGRSAQDPYVEMAVGALGQADQVEQHGHRQLAGARALHFEAPPDFAQVAIEVGLNVVFVPHKALQDGVISHLDLDLSGRAGTNKGWNLQLSCNSLIVSQKGKTALYVENLLSEKNSQ